MRRVLSCLFVVVLALCACQERIAVALEVEVPAKYADEPLALRAAVYAPGAGADVACESLRYGDMTRDALLAALVAEQSLDGEGEIGSVPVEGRKLIVVEAIDDEGALVLFGCNDELATLTRRHQVRVVLVPAVVLEVKPPDVMPSAVDDPAAEVAVVARDAHGAPVAGASVRLRVLKPGGAEPDVVVEETGANGSATLSLAPSTPGPFTVELRPEVPRDGDGDGAGLMGLALPAGTAQAPFVLEGGEQLDVAVPLPAGEAGAAFFARLRGALFSRVELGAPSPSAPATLALVTDRFPDSLLDPVGAYRRDGDEENAIVAWRRDGMLFVRTASGDDALVTVDLEDRRTPTTMVAAGDCDDDDAAPLVFGLRGPRVASEEANDGVVTALAVLTAVGTVVKVETGAQSFEPLLSLCVPDDDGELGRMVLMRNHGSGRIFGMWLGPDGLTGPPDLTADEVRDAMLPEATFTVGRVFGGEPGEVVVARFLGLTTRIERLVLGSRGVVGEPQLLFQLPALPTAIAAGPLLSPESFEVFGILEALVSDGPGRAALFVMSDPTGEAVGGAATLRACEGSIRCRMHAHDADGDGAVELFVGPARRPLVEEAPPPAQLQVIDFSD